MSVVVNRFAARLAGLLVIVVLSLCVVACGSDDDDGSGKAAEASGTTADSAPASGGSDEEQIKSSLDFVQGAFNDRDWAKVCGAMSAEVKQQFKQLEGHATCEKGVADLYTDDATGDPTNDAVQDVSIATVKVDGNDAVVVGKQAGRKGQLQALLVKEGGTWKVTRWFDDNN